MMGRAGTWCVILALVAFGFALTAVAWRQSTTRDTLAEIDRLSRELAVAADAREELARDVLVRRGAPPGRRGGGAAPRAPAPERGRGGDRIGQAAVRRRHLPGPGRTSRGRPAPDVVMLARRRGSS